MATPFDVRVARVYDPPESTVGTRVLVDRLWPRGLAKATAALDDWCKDIAPSNELRHWYAHDPDLFVQFTAMYRAELEDADRAAALANLREIGRHHTITLLTATKDLEISHAAVLANVIPELDRQD
ncbi:MAG TPA: DUF488 family protein [Pseudonocardiaceae bacterium]|nr:DUF488 family protein [Pseudonocardiaceae bacterium]